jgi:hypothetical protein
LPKLLVVATFLEVKWLLWLLGGAVILAALAGFLPPVLARGTLDTDTVNAAKAGSSALSTGGAAAAQSAVATSLSRDPNVVLKSVTFSQTPPTSGSTVTVTATEHVHSWLSGISALDGWFNITSTQQSSLGA